MTGKEETSWRMQFTRELERHGETWADVEAVSQCSPPRATVSWALVMPG